MNREPDEAEVEEWISSIDLTPYEHNGMLWYDALVSRPTWMETDPDTPDEVRTQVDTNLAYLDYVGIVGFGEMVDQHLNGAHDPDGDTIIRAELEDKVRRAIVESMIAQDG